MAEAERDLGPAIRACVLRIDNTVMLLALADRMTSIAGGTAAAAGTPSPTTSGDRAGRRGTGAAALPAEAAGHGANARALRDAGPFNAALADGVLRNAGPAEAPAVPVPPNLLADLNDRQRDAVKAALSLPISYLWGPPRTGKTKTLSAVMRALFAAERRCLVCSNTNQAVDQVLAKLCEVLTGGDPRMAAHVEALRDGWAVRVGAIAMDGPLAAWSDWVSLDGVTARKTREFQDRLAALEQQAAAIERRENVIALGNSGTGKTHIALGLGLAACQKGFSVGFTTAALVHELLEARDEKRLLRLQKQLAGYKLLIIDELGFLPLSKSSAELLFEIFSQRYERSATLVTSNLPFDEWTEILGCERLTGALLGRLTHHVHILEMNGESYRLAQSNRRRRAVSARAKTRL